MRRQAPGSTPVGPRILVGLAGIFSLLFGFQARAAEYVGDYRIVNAPPNVDITVKLDATGDEATTTTDGNGRATLRLAGRRWEAGRGQIRYIDTRLPARTEKWVDLGEGSHVLNLGWNEQTPEQRASDAMIKRPRWYLGVGWGREIHEDSPGGGGVIVQGRVDYPLHDRWSVGAGLGYYWLGSTTTTWLGQTGTVTLSATPLWAEVVYDLKDRGNDLKIRRHEWWERDEQVSPGDPERTGLIPYVALGGGPYWRRTGGDFEAENESALNFGMNLGLGLDNITHQGEAGIGLEVRYHNVIQAGLEGFQMVTANINVKF